MAVFKCEMCDGDLDVAEGSTTGVCLYCGAEQALPQALRFEGETLEAKPEGNDCPVEEPLAERKRTVAEMEIAAKHLEDTINGEEPIDEQQIESIEMQESDAQSGESQQDVITTQSDASQENAIKWQMVYLDTDNDRALFITKDCIAMMPYHDTGVDITWEGCSLRQWLNDTFYNSLPEMIKSRVVETVNQNPDSERYKTFGGNPTNDRVFLLSADEAKKHFKKDSERIVKRQNMGIWWWLRSPGNLANFATGVSAVGTVAAYGGIVNGGSRYVRPALWLDL